ncbi:glycosyltransferase family 4 protein [Alteromonas aestuariivivens]|uniref:Glycosyltransferase family 4 protein n=1 Tax=Alteromonas aestuariivivens TaxID=1938339 RepID=A0A3D8ME92_9ALTE|nr:glycosyltransferase family 4 protein [Alteromonas aestuariivivens]RDV29189.1 glycosyltransferase family 4 protein [Alteromonas aestuariivivens]
MKKVLVLTENFPPIEGGSGRWFWELYSRLPREQVLIVAHSEDGASKFDQSHNLNIIRMPLRCPEWGLKSLTGLKFYFQTIRQLRSIIKQNGITEIHCGRVIHEGVTAWLLNLVFGIPYRCFVHGEDVECAASSREQAWLVRQVCKRARNLICNSQNSAGLVESLGFGNAGQCAVLNPGVDTNQFLPAAPDLDFRAQMGWTDKTVLLTVGRLQQRKGQDYLIEAMPALLKRKPDLFYAIVGRGEQHQNLLGKIQQLGLESKVVVYTNLDDLQLVKCYQQCDLFVLPNRTIGGDIEGFGMVLVEAQACGKPVVAGNSGGTAEALADSETGSIIDAATVASIEKGIGEVLESLPVMDASRQRQLHDKTAIKFGWKGHVKKFSRLVNWDAD